MVINLPALYKAKNRIYRVGCELEGGWDRLPPGVGELHQDVSVRFEQGVRPQFRGELPSMPLEFDKWPAWLGSMYPQHINETCGMHVHMSFKRASLYQRLMCKDYGDTVLDYLLRWAEKESLPRDHQAWVRFTGKNRFCLNEFHADFQATARSKDDNRRRTAINYPFSMHQTVECRVLPMFENAILAEKAIQEVLDITNAFLVTQLDKSIMAEAQLDLPSLDEVDLEEFHEQV